MSEGLFRQLFSPCGSSYLGLSICGSRKYCGMEKEKIPYQFLLHFSYDKAATLCGTSSVHRAWQPPFPTVNLAHTPPAECKWLLSPWWDGELGTWIFTEPWKFESLLFWVSLRIFPSSLYTLGNRETSAPPLIIFIQAGEVRVEGKGR